uniref:5-hydroxytryptamine receptor 1A-like n=1 Tax=Ciona intestinalis TaxID=7719 RepID=UPI000EF4A3B2|nr:5-hydroxytryptamine receptor 1A-like [Ciona intestinalis]|eukprot:XP_018672564.2 5-hydroxytryptamine receptor 1A-like [Ciona intestinalis]
MEDITVKNEFLLDTVLNMNTTDPNQTLVDDTNQISSIFPESIALAILLAIIIIGSMFGNILVVIAVRSERNLQTTANFLICSLAITDFLVACLVMPFSALYEISGTWVFGDILCQTWTAIDIACCTASILHLCAIAFERHRSITSAVRYFSQGRRHTVAPKIVLVWVLAICISIPPILGWKPSSQQQTQVNNVTTAASTVQRCEVGHYREYTLYATLGSFYIPLALLLTAYVRIYVRIHQHIRRSESRTRLESLSSEDALSLRSKRCPPGRIICESSRNKNLGNKKEMRVNGKNKVSQTSKCDLTIIKDRTPSRNSRNYIVDDDYFVTHQNTENHSFPKDQPHQVALNYWAKSARLWDQTTSQLNNFDSICNYSNLQIDDKRNRRISESILQIQKKNRLIKRFSESDVWLAKKIMMSKEMTSSFSRRRAQTTGGRVRFVDQRIKPHQMTKGTSVAQENKGTNVVKRTQDTLHYKRMPSFETETENLRGIFKCCKKYRHSESQRRLLNQRRSSIMLAHSLSLRAKVKLLKAREVRAIKTLGTIVGAFVICWLPFFAVTLAAAFCNCKMPHTLTSIVLWLGYCNSLVNPILYGAFNRDFYAAFKKLYTTHIYKIRCR